MTATVDIHLRTPPRAAQPRAAGRVLVAARRGATGSVLADLHQSGSARALFPREPSAGLTAVLLNTAGGVTGGDRFCWEGESRAGAVLALATQAAERAYRAQPGEVAQVETRLTLGPGSRLEWLPQETILFDGAALERRLDVEMAADASFLAVDALVIGRQAMGETVRRARLVDRRRIRRAGRLVWADTLRLDGAVAETAARPGIFGRNRAAATVILVAPDAADRLAAARASITGLEAGASTRDGVLAVRILAPESRTLRAALIRLLERLRGTPLPRVWTI